MSAALKLPGTLAGVAYASFAVFGLLVWHTLTFVALAKGETPSSTFVSLISLEPSAFFMRLHLSLTLCAVALSVVLLIKPPLSVIGKRTLFVLSLAFTVVCCVYMSPDTLYLPVIGFVCVAWACWPTWKVRVGDA
jgi:hypothetical protein